MQGDLHMAFSLQRGWSFVSEVKNLLSRSEAKMSFLSESLEILAKFVPVFAQENNCMRKNVLLLCFCSTKINRSSPVVQ